MKTWVNYLNVEPNDAQLDERTDRSRWKAAEETRDQKEKKRKAGGG
jgi:hypothetical protein